MSGFDLGQAMFKKQEFESGRLDAFDFRLRVRAFAGLGDGLAREGFACADPPLAALGPVAAVSTEEALLERLAKALALSPQSLALRFMAAREAARTELIREIGDPSPHRLA